MSVPAEAPAFGEGSVELNHNGPTYPDEASTARRRLFAELGVSEDDLLKLVNNAEFMAGIKRLKAAAVAGPSASVTDTSIRRGSECGGYTDKGESPCSGVGRGKPSRL